MKAYSGEPVVLALGYMRVSTDEQAESGAGLAAQRSTIEAEAGRRGWRCDILSEPKGASSGTLNRPALIDALNRLDRGEAQVLIVAKLDRLSRSVTQGSQIIERARIGGWSLVALDFGLDTTTPAGEMVANMVLSVSQYERRMIGVRTREGLAQKRAAGVLLGRPPTLPQAVVARIMAARESGRSYRIIADELNTQAVPTAQGGVAWYPATVRAVCQRNRASRLTKQASHVNTRPATGQPRP